MGIKRNWRTQAPRWVVERYLKKSNAAVEEWFETHSRNIILPPLMEEGVNSPMRISTAGAYFAKVKTI